MINITNPQNCSGCSACESICPKNAISMQPNFMGFLYPQIDTEKCIDCGLCEKVCSFNANYDKSYNLPKPIAYGVRHKNLHEINNSQSGAAFVALSDWILAQGGIVYGVGYEGHFRAVHKRAMTSEERNEFRGSKYVQSDLNGVFRLIKQDLKNGLLVCFSGTPCQTAGLSAYIGPHLRDKLYLIDIICHGVPSPFIWRDYLKHLEKQKGKEIIAVNFRDKSKKGWHSSIESFLFKDNPKRSYYQNYTYFFYRHLTMRSSCSICHFTNFYRPSDITIGDFWGIEKTNKQFAADNKGCSLVLVNTEKGNKWFNSIKTNIEYIPIPNLKDCIQENLQRPSIPHPKQKIFEKEYKLYGFNYIIRKYRKYGIFWWSQKIKGAINRLK